MGWIAILLGVFVLGFFIMAGSVIMEKKRNGHRIAAVYERYRRLGSEF